MEKLAEKVEMDRIEILSPSEMELVRQAQDGDRNAFNDLVRIHHPGIIRVVRRLCNDTHLAEDATQEAFIRAWLKLGSFRPGSSFRNWLYRIAVNSAIDMLRHRNLNDFDTAEIQDLPNPGPTPEGVAIQNEKITALRKAVASLPEAIRSVLVLREYGELSYREIAYVLNIPIGTVMSRLNYARNQLRELLSAGNYLEI